MPVGVTFTVNTSVTLIVNYAIYIMVTEIFIATLGVRQTTGDRQQTFY